MSSEPTRARYPDAEGYAERGDVRVFYEVYGTGEPTIMLIPGWSLPARSFKAQIPYLARHYRVVAFDPRGTGSSSRPRGAGAYALAEHVADALAVMTATGTDGAVVVGKSHGAQTALRLAVDHGERVLGVTAVAGYLPLTSWPPIEGIWRSFEQPRRWRRRLSALAASRKAAALLPRSPTLRRLSRRIGVFDGALMFSRQQMLDDFDAFLEWFLPSVVVTDPHSTRQLEDLTEWCREVGPQAAADSFIGGLLQDRSTAHALCTRVSAPVLVIHGDRDMTIPVEWGRTLAELTGAKLVQVPGSGHLPGARYPVRVNRALREFVESIVGATAEPTDLIPGAGPTPVGS